MAYARKRIKLSPAESEVERNIEEDIDWLVNTTSNEQRELLKHYLVNLDKVHRSNPDSERSKSVQQGVTEIVERIGEGITKCKAELGGRIIPMGSAHNGTKMGDSDEFDFVYEIELGTLLKGKGLFTMMRYQQAIVYIKDRSGIEFITDVMKTKADGSNKEFSKKFRGYMALHITYIVLTFNAILIEVLSKLPLPSGWGHGGFNRPHFSGIRLLGKSYLLQFDYLGTCAETPLRISIDFVPMIKLPSVRNLGSLQNLQKFLISTKKAHYTWLSLQSCQTYFGHAEEQWLSNYSNESTPKKLIRICKVFTKMAEMYSPVYPGGTFIQDIDEYRKAKQNDNSIKLSQSLCLSTPITPHSTFVLEADDFVTLSDLNETMGDVCMVKSYIMKTIIFTMMSMDPSEGRDWTDEDLPDLVIAVYRLLLDALLHFGVSSNKFVDQFNGIEKKIVVAIKETNELSDKMKSLTLQRGSGEEFSQLVPNTIETNQLLGESSTSHSRENLPVDMVKTNFFEATKASLKNMKTEVSEIYPIIRSRISAIFQILRGVCEYKDSVTVTVLDREKVTRDQASPPPFVSSKIEYKDLLLALRESN